MNFEQVLDIINNAYEIKNKTNRQLPVYFVTWFGINSLTIFIPILLKKLSKSPA